MTCRELLREGEDTLLAAGVPDGELDAWYLFSGCFSMDRGRYLLCTETELSGAAAAAAREFRRLVRRRAERIPLQHLLKSQEFMGLSFFVNGHVLIPRQDTETLVETALAGERALADPAEKEGRPYRILDLCTGSGCVGLSLAVYLQKSRAAAGKKPGEGRRPEKERETDGGRIPGAGKRPGGMEIVLADISPEALRVAEENVRRLGMGEICRTVESNAFDAFSGERFDCIVCNPPYIPSGEIETLMPEVRDHEPRIALDGSPDGLAFYRRIAAEAAGHLMPGGRIYLEIGWDQGKTVPEILRKAGFLHIEVRKDLAGNDRVVKADGGI